MFISPRPNFTYQTPWETWLCPFLFKTTKVENPAAENLFCAFLCVSWFHHRPMQNKSDFTSTRGVADSSLVRNWCGWILQEKQHERIEEMLGNSKHIKPSERTSSYFPSTTEFNYSSPFTCSFGDFPSSWQKFCCTELFLPHLQTAAHKHCQNCYCGGSISVLSSCSCTISIWPAVQIPQYHTTHSSYQYQDEEAQWTWSGLQRFAAFGRKLGKNSEFLPGNPGTRRSFWSKSPVLSHRRHCVETSGCLLSILEPKTCRFSQTLTRPTFGWRLCKLPPQRGCERATPPPSNTALLKPLCREPVGTVWICLD